MLRELALLSITPKGSTRKNQRLRTELRLRLRTETETETEVEAPLGVTRLRTHW